MNNKIPLFRVLIISAIAPLLASCVDERSARKIGPITDKIYLKGDFVKEGSFAWTNGMTLNDAIGLGGGFRINHKIDMVNIIHQEGGRDEVQIETLSTNQTELKSGDLVLYRAAW